MLFNLFCCWIRLNIDNYWFVMSLLLHGLLYSMALILSFASFWVDMLEQKIVIRGFVAFALVLEILLGSYRWYGTNYYISINHDKYLDG